MVVPNRIGEAFSGAPLTDANRKGLPLTKISGSIKFHLRGIAVTPEALPPMLASLPTKRLRVFEVDSKGRTGIYL